MTEIRLEKSLPSEQERVGQPSVPAEGLERYFAREGVDPLPYAFEGKIAVHPGLGGSGVEKQDFEATLEPLLAEPRTGKTVAYIHVPFCETHCLYCGFYNKAYREDESRIYADALIQELRLWRGRPGQDAGPVHAVYMGGGTPTALQADDLRRILKEVRAVLPLANDCEITVEGRLSNFGPDKMEACFEGGANRFSLGVQSFDTEIRQAMGRVSDRDTLIRQLQLLQSYDQAAVIVDLIYGFPMQTMERWLADIATAQSLKLDGADCYQLNVYRNTPLAKAIESGRLPAGADVPMQSAMFAAGVKAMQKGFYRRLSISHWARTSRERNLYNLYVKGRAHCLAFGPGAGGNLDGFFYLNQSDYRAWQEEVRAGRNRGVPSIDLFSTSFCPSMRISTRLGFSPRMDMRLKPCPPEFLISTPGTSCKSSPMVRAGERLMSSPVMTETLMGTSCNSFSTLVAVTYTSSALTGSSTA